MSLMALLCVSKGKPERGRCYAKLPDGESMRSKGMSISDIQHLSAADDLLVERIVNGESMC